MEKRLTFAYGHTIVFTRAAYFAILVVAVGILVAVSSSLPVVPVAALAGVLALAAFLYAVSPLLAEHWLTRSRLILRQGWYFRAIIPLSEIQDAGPAEVGSPALGIHRPLGQPTLYVTGSRNGLVVVRLVSPRRFWQSFGLSASEIVFDVAEREVFLRALEERRSLLAPVEAESADA
jgi:hypothetical protein